MTSALQDILRQRARDAVPQHAQASLAARLGFTQIAVPDQVIPQARLSRPVVPPSADLDRILQLPERDLDTRVFADLGMFDVLKRVDHECRCAELGRRCARDLLPIQAHALREASTVEGMVGSIGVGHGKELVTQLLPLVMRDCRTAILLIPPDMREAHALDWEFYGQHWLQPNLVGGKSFRKDFPRLKVIAYSELSHEKFTAALEAWTPDLIMANEAHALCNLGSVRTGRLLTYCAAHPECRFVPLSGTLTKNGLKDHGHLFALALGKGSPLPLDQEALEQWAAAIDPPKAGGKLPALMGALSRLCRPGETAREAYKRRRARTPGVIDTAEASIPCALNIHRREPPPMPQELRDAISEVRRTGTRPDKEEADEAAVVQKWLKELASGFHYSWIYPRGEPEELVKEWFAARQAWNREVREVLCHPVPHLDSPKLCARAAIRHAAGKVGTADKPAWPSRAFAAWRDIHGQVRAKTKTTWISDWLARDAAAWALKDPGIVWVASKALGYKVAELSGLRYYNSSGQVEALLRESGKQSIVCSYKSCGTGKNLQMFRRNLFAEQPPDSGLWEQHIGRSHRQGQQADSVECWVYLHMPELSYAFGRAREQAKYVTETEQKVTRLMQATYTFVPP